MKRIITFILVIVVCFTCIGLLTPRLLKGTKLGLDLKGGVEILYEAQPISSGGKVTKQTLNQTALSLEERANKSGVAEPDVTTEGSNRIRLKIAVSTGDSAQERDAAIEKIREQMKRPAELQFRSSEGCKNADDFCKVELNGADFKAGAAKVEMGEFNASVVHIEVKDKQKLKEVSTRLANKAEPMNRLAIYLDNKLISAPGVQQPLTEGNAVITGQTSRQESQELADIINLGALPLKLTEKYTQSIGATLGQKSLHDTLFAGVLASILIFLFMLIFYRLPGFVANLCLIIFVWLLLEIFYLMGAALTLPGIAAFILGIGIAVDSNIITAERIKDEIRSGKSINSALKAGAHNSFRTIIDAHITTLIAGGVLYFMGHGLVKSFAIVLMWSIVLNIATNVFLPRFFLNLLMKSGKFNKCAYYSVKESEIHAL